MKKTTIFIKIILFVITLYSFSQKTILTLPIKHTVPIKKLIFTYDKRYIFTVSEDNEIKLWYFYSSTLIKTFRGHNNTITSIIADKSIKYLITSDKDGILHLWNIHNGDIIKSLKYINPIETANLNEKDSILTISLSTEELIFLKFPELTIIKKLNTSPYTVISILKGKENGIYYLGLKKTSTNESALLQKGNIQIYDYNSDLFFPLSTYNEELSSLILSPDSTKIISASSDNYTIHIWDTQKQIEDINFKIPYKPGILFCSRTNKMIGIASAEEDNNIFKIYRHTGDEILSTHIDTGIIIFGDINHDITRIHLCNQYGQFRYYDFNLNIRESYGNFAAINNILSTSDYDHRTKTIILGFTTGEVAIMKLYDSLFIQLIDSFPMPVESIHSYNGKAIIHWNPQISPSTNKNEYQTFIQSKIAIIDIDKQKIIHTKTYHNKYICSSAMNNNYYFLGFNDGTIEVLNHHDFSLITTKKVSNFDITQIKTNNNKVYLTTIQPEILIFEISNQKSLIFKNKYHLNNNEHLISLNNNSIITNQHIFINNDIIPIEKITDAHIINNQLYMLKNDSIYLFNITNKSITWNKSLEKKYHQLLIDTNYQFLILVNHSQEYKFLNLKNGESICNLYINNNTQWFCETNYTFDVSNYLLPKVYFVKGIAIDKSYNIYDYYKPKLLQQKLFSAP